MPPTLVELRHRMDEARADLELIDYLRQFMEEVWPPELLHELYGDPKLLGGILMIWITLLDLPPKDRLRAMRLGTEVEAIPGVIGCYRAAVYDLVEGYQIDAELNGSKKRHPSAQ